MFSKACEYAIRATIYLAQQHAAGNRLSVGEIAGNIDAPPSFTAKILQQLNRGGIISSFKGPTGGFFLEPDQMGLSVWDILKAMGEEERITRCVMGLNQCSDSEPCPMHDQYKALKQNLTGLFRCNSISELAKDLNAKKAILKNC
ncbi:MAG TPA: Rrf2 family transcriptional regulator [Sphingobacteriaceae bacterium]